jgi:hypothetical protein
MSTFKVVATLVLVLILGVAWMSGPLGSSERTVPGHQSPGEPMLLGDGPTPTMVLIALAAAVMLGIKVRLQNS